MDNSIVLSDSLFGISEIRIDHKNPIEKNLTYELKYDSIRTAVIMDNDSINLDSLIKAEGKFFITIYAEDAFTTIRKVPLRYYYENNGENLERIIVLKPDFR